ncbi:UDP-3-O-(3-hydroxymyristoyl)glucosamine N-acyltransferase [Allorhodopirellula heiligendammensis]|uniref:UDP-3-O-acylglucosamine N-acyltransferase n=1 Tax=Allorhodopirellula heiligendammensis TaxID=2714739 RepID=A0A5C6BHR8_9BACT|nr:UDP-3-O-(3-hydroxymyristoyl)glucosamine N-acyltransferase [Allorhodopirellula heiligendammensis]TWU10769.1 UDP-3-O-acylglucosamine N-acyltransferase [Allorhodopirellula heiligendammensis]
MTTMIDRHYSAASDPLSLNQIVELTGGHLLPLIGTGQSPERLSLGGAAPPAEAAANEVTMVDRCQHAGAIRGCHAAVVITPAPLSAEDLHGDGPAWQIVVAEPHAAFTQIIRHFRPPVDQDVPGAGIDSTALIHPTAQISGAASIGAGVVIEANCKIHAGVSIAAGCVIGPDCVLYPNVTLYSYCRLGARVVIHAGATLGAHGFGYRNVDGRHIPTAQLGYVQIDDDVEIGASATIDRGTYGATRIGEGTKIDNQVMIGHNCRIGKHNLLCSQVGIAGSCTTGDYVVLAGQVGLKDHIELGDGVIVGAQAGVMDSLESGVHIGSPATPQHDQMRVFAVQRKLPDMRRDIKVLQREVKSLLQDRDQDSSDSASKAA